MKKKYIWLIEIIFWLFIAMGCLFLFIYNTTIKDNTKNTYYIFFSDAGGLVKGSPVKLMGINIGHIQDVKIFDNKVFVSFLVTKDHVSIPKCATATIEFYGLGGSTSLELSPATSTERNNIEEIIPDKTYRIKDYWDNSVLSSNTMIEMYNSLGLNIQKSGIMNNKQILKQSGLIKQMEGLVDNINNKQTVIINKLSENTSRYLETRTIKSEEESRNE